MSNILKEIEKGNTAAVKRILAINPNSVLVVDAAENRTPLHVAAHLGLTDTVKLLLSHEANFEAQDKYGNTALHLACDSGNVATVQALLGAGKKITLRTKNREGQTPLHNAVCLGEVEMVKALMAAGGRLDVKDKGGSTAFDLVPDGREDISEALAMDYGLVYQRTSPQQTSSRRPSASRPSSRGSGPSQSGTEKSPERGMQHSQTVPARRRTEGNALQVPRKQIALHEQAIQGLKSDLQELSGRLDTIQEYMDEKREAIDCSEKVYVQVESHDRQLAELDQRLAFQESHLRDLRPQVGHLGDESRLNREQYQHMKQMVDMWRESVKSSLERVLDRVKEWESSSSQRNAESTDRQATPNGAENGSQEEMKRLEQELACAKQVIGELQSTSTSVADTHAEFEKGLKEVTQRLQHVESMSREQPEDGVKENSQTPSMPHQHLEEVNTKIERLQAQLTKTTSRSERVEEMFDEQLRVELTRKVEQERELSQREAKILEFRRAALEEEQQRRDLFVAHDDQRSRMSAMEARIENLLAKAEKQSFTSPSSGGLTKKIGEIEANVEQLEERLARGEQAASQSGKCCIIA